MAEKSAKKRRKRIFSYYKITENGLKRLLPLCERCGPGYFMADHDDRYTCGHCGFTQYKSRKQVSDASLNPEKTKRFGE